MFKIGVVSLFKAIMQWSGFDLVLMKVTLKSECSTIGSNRFTFGL
jgi:hypothetical protein